MAGMVFLALMPVLLLIGLGQYLRRKMLPESFWPEAERLSYYVLLPSLFFHGLVTARLESLPVLAMAAVLIVSTVVVAGLVMASRPWLAMDAASFTSLFQGSVRFNNYVGVTLAVGLFGTIGVALSAVCNAAIVPTVNVLCVMVFAATGTMRMNALGVARQLAINPLVLSSLAGIGYRLLGLPLPAVVEPALKSLGAASLPLGLLCVGAALDFSGARHWLRPVAVSSVFKFLAMPLATALVGMALGLHGPAFVTVLLFQALPTASSAYILARQMGGNAPLMAGITAMQTVLAFAAIPLVIGLLSLLFPLA